MKKNWKTQLRRLSALVLALAMTLALTSCGSTFDAAGYVDANMKLVTTGDATALEAYTKEASADMEEEYTSEMDDMVAQLVGEADLPESIEQEFTDLLEQMMANVSYSVGEATENDDGSFDVPLTIQPLKINIADQLTEWVNNLDYSQFDPTDTDAIYEAVFGEVASMMKEAANKKEYDADKTFTIHVAKNDEGLYEADEDTMAEVGASLFTTDLTDLVG